METDSEGVEHANEAAVFALVQGAAGLGSVARVVDVHVVEHPDLSAADPKRDPIGLVLELPLDADPFAGRDIRAGVGGILDVGGHVVDVHRQLPLAVIAADLQVAQLRHRRGPGPRTRAIAPGKRKLDV